MPAAVAITQIESVLSTQGIGKRITTKSATARERASLAMNGQEFPAAVRAKSMSGGRAIAGFTLDSPLTRAFLCPD